MRTTKYQYMSETEARKFAGNIGNDIERDIRAENSLAVDIEHKVLAEARAVLSEHYGADIPLESLHGYMVTNLAKQQAHLCFVLCDLLGATNELRAIAQAETPAEVRSIFEACINKRRES